VPSTTRPRPQDDQNVLEATLDVVNAGQQVVLDRVALLRAEVRDDVARVTTSLGLTAAAVGFTVLGYLGVMIGLVVWLGQVWSLVGGLVLVGGVHLLGGIGAAAWTVSYSRRLLVDSEVRSSIENDGDANA